MKFFTKKLILSAFVIASIFSSTQLLAQVISANFNFSPSVICAGVPANFTNTSVGTKIASYSWSFGSGASISTFTGQTPPAIIYSTTGLKTVNLIVTDSLGNSASSLKNILVQSATADAGLDVTNCNGSASTIGKAAASGYTYNWIPSAGLSNSTASNPLANPTVTTTYTLTANASNGCSAVDQVIVTNVGSVKAIAGKDVSVCSGVATLLGTAATVGFNYSWTPKIGLSSATVANPIATPTVTTTYILTVNGASCFSNDTVIITILPSPVLGFNDTLLKCSKNGINIGGGAILGTTYSWLPASSLNSSTISNPTSNTAVDQLYTVTATNGSGCSSSQNILVDVYAPIQAFAGLDQVVCAGNSIILGGSPIVATGGTGAYLYNWQPAATLNSINSNHPVATPTETTTYILTVTDSTNIGCGMNSDTVVLTILPIPHPIINMPTIFCQGALPVLITGLPAGGFFSGPGVIFGSTFDPSDTSIVLGTPYPITYTYSSGVCLYDTAVSVVVFASPIADAGLNQTICTNFGQSTATLAAGGGTSYQWLASPSLSSLNTALTIASPTVNTTYYVEVTLNGCKAMDSVIVTLSNTCAVDSIIIANSDIFQIPSNTTSVLNYLGNDDLINQQIPFSTVIQLGSNHGGTVTMSANHILTYTPATDFIGFDTLIYQICDSVHAPVTNAYLCDTATIIVAVGPNVLNDNYLVKCNDSLFFNPLNNDHYGNGNYPYITSVLLAPAHGTFSLVNNLAQYIATVGFVGTDTIVYEVCVKNLCGAGIILINVSCQLPPIAVDDYLTIKNNQSNPINMLINDTTNGNLVNVQVITGPQNGTYSINPVTHVITYTPNEHFVGNDKIQYVICNPVGCDTAWIYLAIADNYPCQLSTGFSPNNDGINDFYTVGCADKYTDSRLTIFNRWGNIIYDRKGNTASSNSWDGKYNGVDLPDGTYYYIFTLSNSDKNPKTGFIELIR
ncbi:MAG: hypothetical protein RIQ33_697 [Bacteroidota bacterium]|jgi:gliding motility-associated-like protein